MKLFAVVAALSLIAAPAFAKDVYVRGHVRSDGTYVAPHVRSAPNSTRSDNYGPSTRSPSTSPYSLYSPPPRTRDHDRDGTPNYLDRDDDNDVAHDDRDKSQYGSTTSPYVSPYVSPYRKR